MDACLFRAVEFVYRQQEVQSRQSAIQKSRPQSTNISHPSTIIPHTHSKIQNSSRARAPKKKKQVGAGPLSSTASLDSTHTHLPYLALTSTSTTNNFRQTFLTPKSSIEIDIYQVSHKAHNGRKGTMTPPHSCLYCPLSAVALKSSLKCQLSPSGSTAYSLTLTTTLAYIATPD